MKEKLPSNIDMNKLEGGILGEPQVNVRTIPPTPHYPFWRYLCPLCMKFWEQADKLKDFRQYCKECQPRIMDGQHHG